MDLNSQFQNIISTDQLFNIDGQILIPKVDGIPAITGALGVTECAGISGMSGISGTSGISGPSGISGTSGIPEFSGISGFSGIPGISGISGLPSISDATGMNETAYYVPQHDDATTLTDFLNFQKTTGKFGKNKHSKSSLGQPLREQDIFLPMANIKRIMKRVLPKDAKVSKAARECVQESVSEFISFITSEASERCATEQRKTLEDLDVLAAMVELGFDPYIGPLKEYMQVYRKKPDPKIPVTDSQPEAGPSTTNSTG